MNIRFGSMKKMLLRDKKMAESGSEVFVKSIYENTKRMRCSIHDEEQPIGICFDVGKIGEWCKNCIYYVEG